MGSGDDGSPGETDRESKHREGSEFTYGRATAQSHGLPELTSVFSGTGRVRTV
jgi:hypothetical protein